MGDIFLEVSCEDLKKLDDSAIYMVQRMFGERIVLGVNGSLGNPKKDYKDYNDYKNLISNLKTLNKEYDLRLEKLIDSIFLDK